MDHRISEENYEFLTHWEGFDVEDSTWEPLQILYEDVPELCREYIFNIPQQEVQYLWKSQIV